MIFVPSMSDLFHREVPDSFILEVFNVMASTPQHTYQDLTKRPLRMLNFQRRYFPDGFPKNVWAGTSVESHQVVGRIGILGQVKASVKFISAEPLLASLFPVDLKDIDWVITGGESDYKNPRPADVEWFREIRDECKRLGIPYFHKQNGGKTKCKCHGVWGCELLDGKTCHEYPSEGSN